jgi:hypothetical protein
MHGGGWNLGKAVILYAVSQSGVKCGRGGFLYSTYHRLLLLFTIIFGELRDLIWYGRAVLAHEKRGPLSDDDDDDGGAGPFVTKQKLWIVVSCQLSWSLVPELDESNSTPAEGGGGGGTTWVIYLFFIFDCDFDFD